MTLLITFTAMVGEAIRAFNLIIRILNY